MRPPSIVRYEQFYLAAFALGLAATALSWEQSTATFAANPMLAQMMWLLPALSVFGIALRLLLWYFTARQPNVVAKWVVVAFAALSGLGVITGLLALASGRVALLPNLIGVTSSALHVAAAVLLFRPDAKTWFGEEGFADRERGE